MTATERLRTALADRYAIDHEIGSGGMATVYLARDLKHDREVAVKVLRPDLNAVIGDERFLSEVRITAKLDHPHILTLIDSGAVDGILYYVLPYVRGESLRAKLDREKQLGIDEAMTVARQIASALDYAHKQGVVHRDIKPENILFHEGEAVLADFGIALAVKEAGGNRLTETGLSLGTPQYMSPEQATGDRVISARSDIYSLGAVVYEMLVGEPPVTGATAQAMIAKLLTERPTSIRVVRDTVPPGVDAAVSKALAKVPADRFATAGDFVRALDAAMGPVSDARPSRSRAIGYAAVGLVAVAAIAGWFVVRARGTPERVVVADRTQVTFSGRVRLPSISGDGKEIAYAELNCHASGCTYGIDLQAVGSNATRRLFDGASAFYGIEWAPDRRNLIVAASINGVYGSYTLSTIGGAPRRVTPFQATFLGSDSVLTIKNPKPDPDFWLYVGGLDRPATDSIRVARFGDPMQGIQSIPGTKWIALRAARGDSSVWVVIDRAGHEQTRMTTVYANNMVASSDALWMTVPQGGSGQHPIVARVGFDVTKGRLSTRIDTVVRLAPAAVFSVTVDGGTIMSDEGVTEFDGWTADVRDGLRGAFDKGRSVLHSTSAPRLNLSPDGGRLLIGRSEGVASGQTRWSVAPYAGGPELPLPVVGTQTRAFWVDSTTVAVLERSGGPDRLSLMDIRNGARRATLTLPDSNISDFTALPGDGWAWLPANGRSIVMQAAGQSSPRSLPTPTWYHKLFEIDAAPDGSKMLVTGWSAPSADSIGISVFSLPDARETHWTTFFGESGGGQWLADGSVAFQLLAAGETYALYHLTGPGKVERLGSVPRSLAAISVSADLKRMAGITRDQHGDAWTMRVVRR